MSAEEFRLPMPWGHISAKAWGSPKDERVLVVHGILDNAGSFDRLIQLLPRGHYFFCIDLPGHGLSSHFPSGIPLDFFNYVFVIRRVLDYLKWDSCVYIGHSLGANLGLMFGSIYPEKIKKILCLDAVTSRPLKNEYLIPRIKKVFDHTVKIKDDGTVAPRLYTEEEVMYTLMNLRDCTLNIEAAKALMKRAVSKVGNKYKFNRDPRLNISLFPLLNFGQHLSILKRFETPISLIFSMSTLASEANEGQRKLFSILSSNEKYNVAVVVGNHDVHNNNPERVAPHVYRFLGSVKSSL